MRFLADEGIDKLIVTKLRGEGYDVHYVAEDLNTAEDEVLLRLANKEERIIITRDKDFGELVYRMKMIHSGVLLVRLEGLTTQERAEMVCNLVLKYKQQLAGAFSVIQKGMIRIR